MGAAQGSAQRHIVFAAHFPIPYKQFDIFIIQRVEPVLYILEKAIAEVYFTQDYTEVQIDSILFFDQLRLLLIYFYQIIQKGESVYKIQDKADGVTGHLHLVGAVSFPAATWFASPDIIDSIELIATSTLSVSLKNLS